MYNEQIEITFNNGPLCQSVTRRRRRLNRAQWWFQRMRQVVDRAAEWHSAPEPRPEQTWFPGARHANLEREPRPEFFQ